MSIKQAIAALFAGLGVLLLGLFLITGWYTVDESEQAAVITLGQVEQTVSEPGLNFKLPWPIQRVEVLDASTQSTRVGYEEEDGEVVDYSDEAKMITGDENILFVDLVVQWRITNPASYLFNAAEPEDILYNATSASLRGVIGTSEVDDVLTDQRAEIEGLVFEELEERMNSHAVGITILDAKLQDVELPTDEVRSAFTAVTDAREQRLTKINQAERYRNQEINEAEGEADAKISRAEGDQAERVEEARGTTAQFDELFAEYTNDPEVTRQRLVLETLEDVLPNTELYIMDGENETINHLPIRPLERTPSGVEGSGNE
ncbi:membrane protease subunit HflK [Salsuginibacillus halophilus]|uniref:Protein HflK n=1 Tax=Salsuginibacillus halophilus TaxID=517424 RepID=A0A2P8HCY5_9BACI|nr:FtsH protease activity modulator HflK [Salsuginibacillus halophilus]PSL44068.1 membrane protease subunit HflK [Salsuginibacillus halophilus]